MANDWTRSETISPPNDIRISYKSRRSDGTQEKKDVTLVSTTRATSISDYQTFLYNDADGKPQTRDVQSKKTDTTWTTIASVNQSYINWRLANKRGLPAGGAKSENVTTYEYIITTDGPQLLRETSEQYVSEVQFAGGLQIEDYSNYSPTGDDMVLSHRTIREVRALKTAEGREVTQTKTSRWMARGETSEGKSECAYFIKQAKGLIATDPDIIPTLVENYKPLVFEGTEVQIETGRIPVPSKPSDQVIARDGVVNGRSYIDKPLYESQFPTLGDLIKTWTEGLWYGNAKGWSNFVPQDRDPESYLNDSNGDGKPDWYDYVPKDPNDYNKDSNNDGVPDWADYVPDDNGDGTPDWENYQGDSNNDGRPDWQDYVPVGDDFNSDRDYTVPSDEQDPNNDHTITGIVLFQGGSYSSADSTVTATYEMPYAPDDHFEYVKSIPQIIPGGARAAAEAFGRMESALDLGHAFGQNIVTGWNEIPTLDLAPLYVRIAGIEAAFLVDSCSYAWDGNGIVVSADLMLIGVTGWYGTSPPSSSWVRLPVAPSALYQPGNSTIETIALKANSISIPGGFDARNPGPTLALLPTNGADVFAEWRQNAPLVGPTLTQEASTLLTGAALTSIEYPYALTLPPEVTTLEVGASLVAQEFTALQIPAAVVEVAALAPTIATGASVAVPAAVVEVAGLAPAVRLATVLDVPAATVEVVGLPPDLVGRPRIEVLIPAATIEVTGLAPQVLTGTFVEVPTAVIELAGLAPVSVGNLEESMSVFVFPIDPLFLYDAD